MSLRLPQRAGARPRCTPEIPHRQIADNPDEALHRETKRRFLAMPGCDVGPTLISVPGAVALFVPECEACNEPAMMRGREFAHIHPAEDGSFHMVLAPDDAEEVLAKGWGELHPWVIDGRISEQVALIYAPRDEAEIEVVLGIANASHAYATQVAVAGRGQR